MKKTTVKRLYYRNGQLREELSYRNAKLHGVLRTWHRNGRLASEEGYLNGTLHGLCRQWSERGRLLGSYRMEHGTGIQKEWFENGRLKLELSTVDCLFCGRVRFFFRDGTLDTEDFYLFNQAVSRSDYLKATHKNPKLPRYRSDGIKPSSKSGRDRERKEHNLFIKHLLDETRNRDALEWLNESSSTGRQRLLGPWLQRRAAARNIERLLRAGARKVIATDIYSDSLGHEYCDRLVVSLPKLGRMRDRVRRICERFFSERKHGACLPEADIGERHSVVMFDSGIGARGRKSRDSANRRNLK